MTQSAKGAASTFLRTVRTYRRWPELQKRAMVAETYEAGQSVSIVARRHDVNANQLFRWRHQYKAIAGGKELVLADFIPVGVVAEKAAPSVPATNQAPGMMTIMLRDGTSVRVDSDVNHRALRCVLMTIARMT